jgi:hypothetical protein
VRAGDRFEASLLDNLVADGQLLAPRGAPVTGRIVEVREAGRVRGLEQLSLTLAGVDIAGRSYPIRASVATFTARDSKSQDAAVVGGSAAVGALIGGIAKGGRGAATGAAAGAATGAGVILATRGQAVQLDAGTRLDFTLTEPVPVELPPAGAPPALEPPDRPATEDERLDDAGVARR